MIPAPIYTYGLTVDEVIRAYPGAIADDFAAGSLCGEEVIEAEILRQSAKLSASVPPSARPRLTTIRFLRLYPEAGVFTLPFPSLDTSKLIVNADRCGDPPCNLSEFLACESRLPYVYDEVLGTYTLVDTSPTSVLVSYRLAADARIESLALTLLEMVACSLGRRLYAAAEDGDWSLVKYYCQSAEGTLALMDGKWMPPEISALPIAWVESSITSFNIQRVS